MAENSNRLTGELERLEKLISLLRRNLTELAPHARPSNGNTMLGAESSAAYSPADDLESKRSSADELEAVSQHIEHREKLIKLLGADLVSDPVWSMLLELYSSDLRGQIACVKVLCLASGVPATTALRWLTVLEDRGWIAKQPDARDGRRMIVDFTEEGRDLVAALL